MRMKTPEELARDAYIREAEAWVAESDYRYHLWLLTPIAVIGVALMLILPRDLYYGLLLGGFLFLASFVGVEAAVGGVLGDES